jgi:NAD-dependent deacetylase
MDPRDDPAPASVAGPPDGVDPDAWRVARRLLSASDSVAVLTGAGISTDSGIADFRGPQGVWTKNPEAEKQSTLEHYLGDPAARRRAWRARLDSPVWRAQPNAGHRALLELERRGRLHTLVTQNVDGLHLEVGHDPTLVVEVHGNARRVRCWTCDDRAPITEALDRVREGEDDPACRRCGGILKTTTVLFGEALPAGAMERAAVAAADADVLLAVGTMLSVYPVASMVHVADRAGTPVVIVNGEPTELDHLADAVLHGPIGTLLPALVDPD